MPDPAPTIPLEAAGPILLFDGVCNLCNGAVNWIIDHDPAGRIRLGALQSEAGAALMRVHELDPTALGSLVLIDGGRAYTRSDGALRVAGHLGGPWRRLRFLRAIPKPLRDVAYDLVARYRYRWFGQRAACRVPTPELRARFI